MSDQPVACNASSGRRGGWLGYRSRPIDVLDYSLFLPSIFVACALGPSIRLIGAAFVVIPIGSCLLYAVLRRAVPPLLLSAYVGFCLIIAVLSRYRLMPDSWQLYFFPDAIVRQLVPLLGFFAVGWASKAYFHRRLISDDPFWGAPVFLLLTLAVAPVVMLQQGLGYEGHHSVFAIFAILGAFVNNVMIYLFFLLGLIFLARDFRRYLALALVLSVAVATHFLQYKLLTAAMLATILGLSARKVAIGVIGMLLAVYGMALHFLPEIMALDPNDGLRLAMLHDTFRSVADTYGIGVGYGKESVRWIYRFANAPPFTFLPNAAQMTHSRMLEALSTGVENSFAESLLRTGIVGCTLLVAAIFVAFPSRNLPRPVRSHATMVFCMLFIGCFVNSSLETPLNAVGLGFAYGYLLALSGCYRARVPRLRGPFRTASAPGGGTVAAVACVAPTAGR